jgi:recombination protein RecR
MAEGAIQELITLLARLPGIGERTATRLAFHILSLDVSYSRALGRVLSELHERVQRCELCGNFGSGPRCSICTDPRRDAHVLCVVARVPDLIAIERSARFRGRYHVLHALLAPLDGVGPDKLPVQPLIDRIGREGIDEVIVATPLSVDGEATSMFLAQALRATGVRTTRIASGVPHGGDLEFTDQVTMSRAFEGRRDL